MKAQWSKSSQTPVLQARPVNAAEDSDDDLDPGDAEEPEVTSGFNVQWYDAIEPDGWITNLDRWVCSCPSFLLSRFLVCKHIINMVDVRLDFAPLKDRAFFVKLRRYHSAPFYRIEGIHTLLDDPTRPAPRLAIDPALLSTQSRSTSTTIIPGAGLDEDEGVNPDQGFIEPTLADPFPNRER